MVNRIINLYRNVGCVYPHWKSGKKIIATVSGLICFLHHRYSTFQYIIGGSFPYSSEIKGKGILDRYYLQNGVVFFSVHSGPYPLAAQILFDRYPSVELVVPFYRKNKISVYPIFRRFFPRLHINIVALGGAMREIRPVLRKNGSICLFLDAELPVSHTLGVKLFGKTVPLTTSPVWLAKTYHKTIIPIFTVWQGNKIVLNVQPPIVWKSRTDQQVMNDVALDLEKMIKKTVFQWQVMDRFLLQS